MSLSDLRKLQRTHKVVKERIWDDFYGPLNDVISGLQAQGEGKLDARIECEYEEYDGYKEYYLVWWEPKTEAEIEKSKKEAKKQREARAAKKIKDLQDKEQLLRDLAEELGKRVVDSENS